MRDGVDSKIQAKVRILLARRWVDLQSVTIGTTNGVVYVGGSLRTTGGPGVHPGEWSPSRREAFEQRIRREIASIPDVRDVVFRFQHQQPPGGTCPERAA